MNTKANIPTEITPNPSPYTVSHSPDYKAILTEHPKFKVLSQNNSTMETTRIISSASNLIQNLSKLTTESISELLKTPEFFNLKKEIDELFETRNGGINNE